MKQPPLPTRPRPVRIMDGDQLAAIVTCEAALVTIRPEPSYKVETVTLNVTLAKERRRRRKKGEPPDAA